MIRVLLDSGSTGCLIKKSALPKGVVPKTLAEKNSFNNLSGKLTASEMVTPRDIRLPDFDKNISIAQHSALVSDNDNYQYYMILGTNFLSKTGIKLDCESGNMEWYKILLPMRPAYGLNSYEFDTMVDMYHIQVEYEILVKDWLECFATEILDTKYEWTDVRDIVQHMDHLSQTHKDDILKVL